MALEAAHVCASQKIATLQAAAVSDIANKIPTSDDVPHHNPYIDTDVCASVENEDVIHQEPGTDTDAGITHLDDVMVTSGTPSGHMMDVIQALHSVCIGDLDRQEDETPSIAPPVMRAKHPVNEIEDTERLISCCFPHLFLLGGATFKQITLQDAQYLMRFHDSRFSQCPQFLYYLHNRLQRHAANIQVKKMCVQGTDEQRAKFLWKINSAPFKEKLVRAMNNPQGPEAPAILREVQPHLRVGSSTIPNGQLQSEKVLSELRALVHYMGLPGLFVTVAPAEFNSVPVM